MTTETATQLNTYSSMRRDDGHLQNERKIEGEYTKNATAFIAHRQGNEAVAISGFDDSYLSARFDMHGKGSILLETFDSGKTTEIKLTDVRIVGLTTDNDGVIVINVIPND